MTASLPRKADSWTFDDLHELPDDGKRYELIDGRLLVSPVPALPHYRALTLLQRLMVRAAPVQFAIGQNAGILDGSRKKTYLIPDLLVSPIGALKGDAPTFNPADALLVVEVLSPGNRKNDEVLKRRCYARMGIPQYWIVDPKASTLHVMRLAADPLEYHDIAMVKAGAEWRTEDPFPLTLDPAEFC